MKKLNHLLWLFMLCSMMTAIGSGCSNEKDENNTGTPIVQVDTPSETEIYATSATFTLHAQNVESYAYQVIEGTDVASPDGAVIYADAQGKADGIVPVTSENMQVTIYGLEGGKSYSVFFAFKADKEYLVEKQVINTPAYSDRLTIIESGMYSIKFHVEMPEDEYFQYTFMDREYYETFVRTFGYTDFDMLLNGFNSPRYQGSQTITIADGENPYKGAINESEWSDDESFIQIKPGTGYVIIVGQCDQNGQITDYIGTAGETSTAAPSRVATNPACPNLKEYTEVLPPLENGMSFEGKYAKQYLFTQAPVKGPGKVEIVQEAVTEKSALFTLKPTQDVLKYGVAMFDTSSSEFESMLTLAGGPDGFQALALRYSEYGEGAMNASYTDLVLGHEYKLYVIAVYDEAGSIQTIDSISFAPAESQLPACELEVTALQLDQPYQIAYNIKAPNKDCSGIQYLCNYTREWWPQLNGIEDLELEEKLEMMISMYGQNINSSNAPSIINAINSDEGYDMYFSSEDETESWLILMSYNIDEKGKLFYDGNNFHATAGSVPTETPVDSELFQTLKGEWVATMTRSAGTVIENIPVTISDRPTEMATLPSDVKQDLINYFVTAAGQTQEEAEQTVMNYFQEYQEGVLHYAERYAKQNYLIAYGFQYDAIYAPFASSWDLFKDTSYSAYDTDELFRDFGSKLFFKISKDNEGNDVVTVVTTAYDEQNNYSRFVDPMSAWKNTLELYGYDAENANNFEPVDFPVEISDDFNTLTILPAEKNGKIYTPSITATYSSSAPSWNFTGSADGIVLTRATASTKAKATQAKAAVKSNVQPFSGNHHRKTRIAYSGDLSKKLMVLKPVTPKKIEVKIGK